MYKLLMKKLKDKLISKYMMSQSKLSPEFKLIMKRSFTYISLGLLFIGLAFINTHQIFAGIMMSFSVSIFVLNSFYWR